MDTEKMELTDAQIRIAQRITEGDQITLAELHAAGITNGPTNNEYTISLQQTLKKYLDLPDIPDIPIAISADKNGFRYGLSPDKLATDKNINTAISYDNQPEMSLEDPEVLETLSNDLIETDNDVIRYRLKNYFFEDLTRIHLDHSQASMINKEFPDQAQYFWQEYAAQNKSFIEKHYANLTQEQFQKEHINPIEEQLKTYAITLGISYPQDDDVLYQDPYAEELIDQKNALKNNYENARKIVDTIKENLQTENTHENNHTPDTIQQSAPDNTINPAQP